MKTKILVGAVAALLYGGVALANDKDCPPGSKDTQSSLDSQSFDNESRGVIETAPVQEGIGGSGQVGMDDSLTTDENVQQDENAQQDLGVSEEGVGGSGYQEPLRQPEVAPPPAPIVVQPEPVIVEPQPATPSGAFTPTEPDQDRRESRADMRGLTLMVGGGVEGYTGGLAPELNPGPAYGVTAALKPSKVFGVELGYTGAVNNIESPIGGASSGPDLVRNGGQAAVTLGLGAAPVQPYLLGGIGFSDYNFRGSTALTGLSDDTVGNVPVGAGLRTHIGDFTADLRANYNFLFDQEFAAGIDDGFSENGSYSGTLNIGGTF